MTNMRGNKTKFKLDDNGIEVSSTFNLDSPSGVRKCKNILRFDCIKGALRKITTIDMETNEKLSKTTSGIYYPTVDWEYYVYPELTINLFLKLGDMLECKLKQLGFEDIIPFKAYIKDIKYKNMQNEELYLVLNEYNTNPYVEYYYTRLIHFCRQETGTKLYNISHNTQLRRNKDLIKNAKRLEYKLTYNNKELLTLLFNTLAGASHSTIYLEVLLSFANLVQLKVKTEKAKEYIYSNYNKDENYFNFMNYIINYFNTDLFIHLLGSNEEVDLFKSIEPYKNNLTLISDCIELYSILTNLTGYKLNMNNLSWKNIHNQLVKEYNQLVKNKNLRFYYNYLTYTLCCKVDNYIFDVVHSYKELKEISNDINYDLSDLLKKILSNKVLLISIKDMEFKKFISVITISVKSNEIINIYGDNINEINEWKKKCKDNIINECKLNIRKEL